MAVEYNEKGKFFTSIITKKPVNVIIQTTNQMVEGKVHIRPDERLKDEIDRDELFLAVTDATMFSSQGQVIYTTKFIALRRDHIVWIIPTEEMNLLNKE